MLISASEKTSRLGLLSLAILLVSPSVWSQGPNERWHYYQTEYDVAIEGFDPVSYFRSGEARMGSRRFELVHRGLFYRFSSSENMELFESEPERYLPICGGWDAFFCGADRASGVAPGRWPSDPSEFVINDGKLLLFSVNTWGNTRDIFENGDAEAITSRAEEFWASREALAERIGRLPEGMHRRAPMEHGLWAPLMGTWRCRGRIMIDRDSRTYRDIAWAHWKFGYGFDGYMIEDHWLPEHRTASGPALRYWDPLNQQWVMMFIAVGAAPEQIWMMRGEHNDEGFHGEFTGQSPQGEYVQQIHFVDITENSFRWYADRSVNGSDWIENFQFADCWR